LLSVPLFHVTGEVPVMINSFVIGRCMVVMPKWDATEALRLIEKERITYFVGVPTMSLEIMNHPDRDKYDLSSMTDITAGGAPRPVSHVERLQETFPKAQPALGYGLTETNAAGFSNFWGNYAAKPASTGRAQEPYIETAILGPREEHLPPGQAGEIAIRSAANIKGYWRNPEATAALFTPDGYIRTGDIGYLDEDGYLFIVDRKKEIIIRGGENISAAEVEAACYSHEAVAEVSVFGAPDERLGEVPVAVVHAKPGIELSEEDLRGFLDGQLAKFKIPARVIFSASSLPRLGTGKIDRRTVLIGGGAGVGLVVAFALWPRHLKSDLPLKAGEEAFGNFIKVGRDGRVTVAVPQTETGQGIWTGLPQIVADELGAAWETVAVEPAPLAKGY
jgi:acyl-CoA synthetase (AMP-forming)/AMP-acid ligase II